MSTEQSDNPTSPTIEPPVDVTGDARLRELHGLIEMMRSAVRSDGGELELLGANTQTGVVEVRLSGACSSCAISSTTLRAGVERALRDRLDWVTEVIGDVDEDFSDDLSASLGRGGYVPRYRPHLD